MTPTGQSVPNSRNESLNNSGTSSGATIPKAHPAKVRRNETALAAPAIAVEMVSETAILAESTGSE